MGYYPDVYGPALYDFYYDYGRRLAHLLVESIKEHLEPDARVLDVGTGTGFVAFEVAPLIAGGQVVGLDREEDAIILARHKARRAGVSNVTFQVGDAANLEFDDASFDVMLAAQLFGMVRDPHELLGSMLRVLRPGGLVAFGRPAAPEDEVWQYLHKVRCEFSARRCLEPPERRDQWTEAQTPMRNIAFMKGMFLKCGLDIVSVEQVDLQLPAGSFEEFVLSVPMGQIDGFAKSMLGEQGQDADRETIVTACLDFLEIGKHVYDEKYKAENTYGKCVIAVGRK
jgi:ubiquinone/menaquinone biosynthesis C-methylase UbiE